MGEDVGLGVKVIVDVVVGVNVGGCGVAVFVGVELGDGGILVGIVEGLDIKVGDIEVGVLSAVQLAKNNVTSRSHIWTIDLDVLDIVGAIIIHFQRIYSCIIVWFHR